jgi:hypothetical protein
MQVKFGGEASIKIPGECLSPTQLRSLSEKRLKKRKWLPWSKTGLAGQELLFVPYSFFRYTNPKHMKQYYLYDVLVDGILGHTEFIRGSFELVDKSVSHELLLERTVHGEDAEGKARKAVEAFAVRRQSLWVKEVKVDLIDSGEFYYPYWVCYLETPKGVELLALNGLTGTPAGHRPEHILRGAIARMEWKNERG